MPGVFVDGKADRHVFGFPSRADGGSDGGANLCASLCGGSEDGDVDGCHGVGWAVAREREGGEMGAGREGGQGEGCAADLRAAVGPAAVVQGQGYWWEADAVESGEEDLLGVFEAWACGDVGAAVDGQGYGEGRWRLVGVVVRGWFCAGGREEEIREEGLEDEEDTSGC